MDGWSSRVTWFLKKSYLYHGLLLALLLQSCRSPQLWAWFRSCHLGNTNTAAKLHKEGTGRRGERRWWVTEWWEITENESISFSTRKWKKTSFKDRLLKNNRLRHFHSIHFIKEQSNKETSFKGENNEVTDNSCVWRLFFPPSVNTLLLLREEVKKKKNVDTWLLYLTRQRNYFLFFSR